MSKSGAESEHSEADNRTIALIDSIATQVRADIEAGKLPNIRFPVRALDNVTYDKAKGYFELGNTEKERTLTVTTAKSFAQALRLMATSRAMVEHNDFATKREVYYISKNWGGMPLRRTGRVRRDHGRRRGDGIDTRFVARAITLLPGIAWRLAERP